MADTKISSLTALTGASVDATADVLPIVDTSATTTKKILVEELGIAMNASQAQQEAGTATKQLVSPAVQQFHPSAAKAWVSFDGTAANPITKAAGYNISGTITKNGTGDYTVTFTTAFSSGAYCALVCSRTTSGGGALTRDISRVAGSYRFGTTDTAGGLQDFAVIDVVFFGDQ